MQRLKKVGLEFCDEPSEKLMECMKKQSLEFFKQYHLNCLDEINLFLDHEIWIQVSSFSSILQLQEYRNVKRALHRHALTDGSRAPAVLPVNTPSKKLHDNDSSVNSQVNSEKITSFYDFKFNFLKILGRKLYLWLLWLFHPLL